MQRGEAVQVWGDGSVVRDYLYIDDLVGLITAVLSRPMPVGAQLLNACSGIPVSINQLLAAIESATGGILRRTYAAPRSVTYPG